MGARSMYQFPFRCSRPTRSDSKSERAGPNVTVPLERRPNNLRAEERAPGQGKG